MAIIIEGMDATGKSTLAKAVASHFNLKIKESEGPPVSRDELHHRVTRYNNMVDTLFVRHPCVSHNIYNICHTVPFTLDVGDFYHHGHTFIYCAPTNLHHIAKPGEDETFIAEVGLASDQIRRMYNMWAIQHAHIIYHLGDDPQRIIDMLQPSRPDLVRDIRDFHTRFDIAYDGPPRHLPLDLYDFREKFLTEEAFEYTTAPTLAKRFDALVDSVYVAIGSAHLHGFDFYEGWRRVHSANMLKVRAAFASDSLRNSTHDVVKPPGWSPPDLEDLC
jgi:predicted HAD superfamily Cof-like phosphohydrolase